MNRFQANDLRNLVTEVVSAYQAEKRNKERGKQKPERYSKYQIVDQLGTSWSNMGSAT